MAARRNRPKPANSNPTRGGGESIVLPAWIKPQLAKLVEKAPDGPPWLHEIKFDGYRMHARLAAGRVQILTRQGNDWKGKYPAIVKSIYAGRVDTGMPVAELERL